jgi:hypothetical protein
MRAAGAGVSPAAARLQAMKRSRQRKIVAEPVRTHAFQEKQAFLEKQARDSSNAMGAYERVTRE